MLFNFEQTLSIPCHFSTYFVFIIIFWKLITDIRFDVRQVHFKPFSRVTEREQGIHLDPAEDSMPTQVECWKHHKCTGLRTYRSMLVHQLQFQDVCDHRSRRHSCYCPIAPDLCRSRVLPEPKSYCLF